ncbi:MAG TPA: PEP-CTERM sorting domain-containing protein [Pirellulales bacterium]|jgi:hypothetical protein
MIRTFAHFVFLSVALCAQMTFASGLVIGTWNSTRAGIANIPTGEFSTQAVASLETNFPGMSFKTTTTLTPQFFQGVNMLFIDTAQTDSVPITPLSSSEQSALLNFVKGGGSAFLLTEGYAPFVQASQSVLAPFGITIADDNLDGLMAGNPVNEPNPIFDGPYGSTASILLYGAGDYPNLGPHATSLADNAINGLPVMAVIPPHALSPTSGAVVMVADSTSFIDVAAGGAFTEFEPLFLNTVTYLTTPEPGSLALALLGGAVLVGVAGRRRR